MKHRPGPGWSHWLLSPVHEQELREKLTALFCQAGKP